MSSNFDLDLAIDQACERAQQFLDQLRKDKPRDGDQRMSDVRLLDAFLRQIPIPPLPDRPIGAIPLLGLRLGIVLPGDAVGSEIPREDSEDSGSVLQAFKPLLRFIYSGEGGYNSYNRGRAGDSPGGWPGGLQILTISQVMQLQKEGRVFAVGAAQFIPSTLPIALRESGLTVNDFFDSENQDRLAMALLLGTKRPILAAYLKGENNDLNEAQIELAKEWASVPMPNGRGYYDNDSAGNRATHKVAEVRKALQNARNAFLKVKNNDVLPPSPGSAELPKKPRVIADFKSPNFSSRNNIDINTIIVHYTVIGNVKSVISHFRNSAPEGNPNNAVSAHYVIDKNGDIYQMVDDVQKAWHAVHANAYSIGIEHVAAPGDRLTEAQESSSVQLIKWLMAEYKIPKENIKAHMEVVATQCPGNIFGDATNDTRLPKLRDWVAKNFSTSITPPNSPLGPSGLGLHIVQVGETLSLIADRHDTSLNELLAINPSIQDADRIFPGQKIIVARVDGDDSFVDSNSRALKLPISISEKVLDPTTYQVFDHPSLGNITITGGYMEPHHAHSHKPALQAIFANGNLKTLPAARRNIGIDYVVADRRVKAWYGGRVTRAGREGGYGRRVHIQLDISFDFNGKSYSVYQAYAHLQQILVSEGQIILQGQQIAIMGGSGARSDSDYPPHADLSTYIFINRKLVQLNPQAIDMQLEA